MQKRQPPAGKPDKKQEDRLESARSIAGDSSWADMQNIDLSDALFLDTLLLNSIEQYPRYVWLWDECIPDNEYYH
ncbi:hypothetical protein [Amphritea balenae]|uniref:Uncharacterized protein n=1 Tax=Amphritea balenae TaxID=452629 RepID=A0A3P1SIC8_9GAMM|nr:hypothetical protein [Amphritea balenae]RRC96796.1 hypothetical protein EHS89_20385 [Amphritea balenae]GGK84914.1 hypothetical protein GCM10007941_39310 [Amphritea balenae]